MQAEAQNRLWQQQLASQKALADAAQVALIQEQELVWLQEQQIQQLAGMVKGVTANTQPQPFSCCGTQSANGDASCEQALALQLELCRLEAASRAELEVLQRQISSQAVALEATQSALMEEAELVRTQGKALEQLRAAKAVAEKHSQQSRVVTWGLAGVRCVLAVLVAARW
jgi:hypothetical protein